MNPHEDDPPEFTMEQLQAALRRAGREAVREAFAAGQSVMIVRDGSLVLLFPDGHEEIVGPVQHDGIGVPN